MSNVTISQLRHADHGAVTRSGPSSSTRKKQAPSITVKNQPTISPAELFLFSFVTGPIPIYTGSMPGLVPNYPSSYSSSLSFSPCAYGVHTTSSEICNVALKYVMPPRNMSSRRHAHVRKSSLRGSPSTTAPRTCR